MKKNVCLALLAGVLCSGTMAQSVDLNTAKKIAENYCHQMNGEKNFTVKESHTQMNHGKAVYHIINFKEGGFAIVSADEKANPVIAYSTENSFDMQMKNPALKNWMNTYANEIENIINTNVQASTKVRQDWENLKNGKPMFRQKGENAIEPLLTCIWNQDKYYNTNCPADDDTENGAIAGTAAYDNHVPVGCVALSASQIMYYHRYPEKGIGTSSYTSSYGKLTANYGKTKYNYNNMNDLAIGYSNDLAQLINHVGIAVEMGYGADGSGTQTQKLVSVLRKNFAYSSSIQFSERINYTNENWHKLLLDNLKQGLPMVYSGVPQDGGAGHAFNCDGYDGNGKFHMNWGWAGSSNGYYDIDNMNKVGSYDLSSRHQVVCNIKPQSFTPKAKDTLTATYGSFGRGNMYVKYKANENLSWYICPPNATGITLDCSRFSIDTNDTVSIYTDPSLNTLIATFSGSDVPKGKSLQINGGTAYITFISSSESKGGNGFLFTYTTTLNDLKYCNTTRLLSNTYRINETSGKITNGSDGKNYADANECYWRIEPQNANALWITFETFDLAEGDILYLYNYKAQNTINPSVISGLGNIVAAYTKANPPEIGKIIEFEKNGLYLYFRTDNDIAGKGWSFNYGVNVGIDACHAGISACNVFPNPATDQLNVRVTFEANEGKDAQIRLTDVLGRTVYRNMLQSAENDAELLISTADMAAGMYILNIQTAKGSVSKKVQIVR